MGERVTPEPLEVLGQLGMLPGRVRDWGGCDPQIQQPVLIVMGEDDSTIDRTVAKQVADSKNKGQGPSRMQDYLDHFPQSSGVSIAARNIPPYESADEFSQIVQSFVQDLSNSSVS